MTARPFVLAVLFIGTAGCGGGDQNYPDYDNPREPAGVTLAPPSTGDGWVTSTPAAEGINEAQLAATFELIRGGNFPGVDSMVVVRNQRLVAEGYFNGFGRDTLHDLRSTGKSFVSTLAGIAFEQGLVHPDDRISQHIPNFDSYQNVDAAKRAITLRHLLNMHSGLDCSDWTPQSPGHEEKMYDSRDWIGFMLNLRMALEPGGSPSYCTGGVVLLGHVIALRSGLQLDTYAQQWLFDPLDIRQSHWRFSPDGRATGATGFGQRPRDAAKLGALFANEGVWNGVRIVPESWALLTRESPVRFGADGYGYLWWKRTFTHPSGALASVYTAGNGGNHVFIIPSLELVVAFTGSNYNTSRSETPHRLMELLLPAVP